MFKLKKVQWIGLIPFVALIIFLFVLWCFTRFNKSIFYVFSIVIITFVYVLTYLLSDKLFELGENNIKENDKDILILEKEEASLWWMYLSGAGFTFLVGGIPIFNEQPLFAIIGLSFLVLGNLFYNLFYFPRYRLLYKKKIVELEINKNYKSK